MKFRQLLACILLLAASISASAATGLIPDLQHLDALPIHSLPALKMQRAVKDAISKGQALQFAVSAPLALTLGDGTWQQLSDGTWSWRTRVFSAGAQTLNLHFSRLHLPEGAALWLYDPQGAVTAGPYTPSDLISDEQLWTAIVNGETAIIELRTPANSKDQVELQLSEVNHGYRGFAKAGTGSFDNSGSCEIDVACPAGNSYLTQARALARISVGGTTLCSGQLINNVRQDNTPFFLTANHCGITSANATSVVFYWNYQNGVCGGNGVEPTSQNQSHSVWVAGDVTSDFTLIKAAQAPSTSFNLYLAGWYAGSDAPRSGGVVHHPAGDVTKIALYDKAPSSVNGATLCDGQFALAGLCLGTTRKINVWQVNYSQGITEPGSSGSALYNQNHLIVGVLSGGSSACSGNSGNGQPDIYARTNAAWTANAAANGQLKANLDPDNTGTLQFSGKNLGEAAPTTPATGSSSSGSSSSSSGSSGGGSVDSSMLLFLLALAFFRRLYTYRRC